MSCRTISVSQRCGQLVLLGVEGCKLLSQKLFGYLNCEEWDVTTINPCLFDILPCCGVLITKSVTIQPR
ncbi:hypothetical protein GN956_G16811 [Arapaima gigas]